MTVEIKGQQLRIRVRNLKYFTEGTFRTHDVGKNGKLHRIAAIHKVSRKWRTQSWRLNLLNYSALDDIYRELGSLYSKEQITRKQYVEAAKFAKNWWLKR